jgi:hypothetical protein
MFVFFFLCWLFFFFSSSFSCPPLAIIGDCVVSRETCLQITRSLDMPVVLHDRLLSKSLVERPCSPSSRSARHWPGPRGGAHTQPLDATRPCRSMTERRRKRRLFFSFAPSEKKKTAGPGYLGSFFRKTCWFASCSLWPSPTTTPENL